MIEEAQTKIKLLIRDFVLDGKGFLKLDKAVQKQITETVKELEFESLKQETRVGLNLFAEKVYKQFVNDLGYNYTSLMAAVKLLKQGAFTQKELDILNESIAKTQNEIAVPNQEYHKVYMGRVKTALDNMRKVEAKQYGSGISLRNVAEMQVRYENHAKMLNDLRERGENAVVCSTHANCSSRCEPWQGKHYTLDGSTKVIDGKTFIPLETAVDVYVATRSGKTYKNGLLGYNCRHKILSYRKNEQIPNVGAKEIEREREIDKRMRELERGVRSWKEERDLNQNIDRNRYLYARQKAIDWNKKYIQYAQENQRAYYPDRVKII